ncbi:non-ribosomal peptide synthase protein (TIGR01720 family)/amino acid adenylation domain-containing protein [Paraburkholderia bryophila]|uniref:Non-ribosomal peptide synthase protein (TIGR01720 family)/amino acid adenylation domain-containing protein n=1 Tax=Paraburkholderia bryophila TaxID=420952 RepID=A0A329CKX5_9BURK|nr:non-ribosomal peptide synthase protein (TIGR01720 family)/amino acid adenylation domain-containing protein [Paraburkholderia bryophila]
MNALNQSLAVDESVSPVPAHDADELLEISRRYASLPHERRRTFREKLRSHGFDIGQLPVVALPADAADTDAAALVALSPLSPAQERLWFLWRLNPAGVAYNMSGLLRLRGAVDEAALHATFTALVTRHASLRTRFAEHDGEPRQRVDDEPAFGWASHVLAAPGEAQVQATLERLAWQPFDLEQGPLLRVDLVRTAADDLRLLVSMHHIVSDGWSIGVLFAEFLALYEAAATSAERVPLALEARAGLEPLRIQYADYARWQREWFDAEALAPQLDYWRAQLAPAGIDPLALPFDRSRKGARAGTAGTVSARVPAATAQALRQVAQARGTTLFAALLAAFDVLLYRYTGAHDVRVGVPVAGRHGADTAGLIGFFVNMIVMRVAVRAGDDYATLLDQVSVRLGEGQGNQDLPFARLVEALQPTRETGRTPLFDVVFNMRQHPSHRASLPGLEVESAALNVDAAQFDLSLNAAETPQGIELSFDFASDVFDTATVERLLAHYVSIVEEAAHAPQTRIGAFGLADSAVSCATATATAAAHPAFAFEPVSVSIETQARLRPDSIAVSCDGETLTYAQLDAWSNRIAHRLVALGVKRDERVGVSLERSCALVASLLGVLKAGGAYVPLDPSYPATRLSAMIADANVTRVVLDDAGAVFEGCEPVQVADVGTESSEPCGVVIDPEQLAYVIFTSGSTGRPKGVGITQANVARLLSATRAPFAFDERDVWTLFHSYAFDFSVWEIFGALVHGARLVVVPYWSARDTRAFHALLREQQVTVLNQTPSAFVPLMQHDLECRRAGAASLDSLRVVVFGGEKLEPSLLGEWIEAGGAQAPAMVNMYGITETTVHVTYRRLARDEMGAGARSVIGEALADLTLHVLDEDMNPVPRGATGELYVGGAGLARGYLGRPGLSAERFVPDPWSPNSARLYRSGDLARREADGEIVYIGRNDAQVKIRGFRIELGEIDAALAALPSVREARVLAHEGRTLVAYVVPRANQACDVAQLEASLAGVLPAHMVPGAYVLLDALPLTHNGKLDRAALPAPQAPGAGEPGEHVEPVTPSELALAQIWRDVLGLERVGAHDDFFRLGGDSLLAVRVLARIRGAVGHDVPLQAVFDHPELQRFARYLDELAQATPTSARDAVIPRLVQPGEAVALSHAQERMWMLWRLEPDSAAYNIAGALQLNGDLSLRALRSAMHALVRRHDALRLRFTEAGGVARQQIVEADDGHALDWREYDLQGRVAELDGQLRDFARQPFDLLGGPALRAALFTLDATTHVLALSMHHIIADGWSIKVLIDDFSALYTAALEAPQQATTLRELPIRYADFALWQRTRIDEAVLDTQLDFWRTTLGASHPALDLPVDRERREARSGAGGRVSRTLPRELGERLRASQTGAGVTLFMSLLAAFDVLLYRYTGSADIRVGIPAAGRERIETEGVVGFFVNTLVIRSELRARQSFAQLAAQVRDRVLAAHANQDVPFGRVVDALQPERNLLQTPLFQVMFDLRVDDGIQALQLPGLTAQRRDMGSDSTQFDLMLHADERDGALELSFSFASDVFDTATVERLLTHYVAIVEEAARAPQTRIGAFVLADSALSWGTATAAAQPGFAFEPVSVSIETQARLRPDALAVSCDGETLTYAQLDAWSNRIAHRLVSLGVKRDERVGVSLDRSCALVASLLGVLKAGGAYVPLDPSYPAARLSAMIADANVTRVVLDDAGALFKGCEPVQVADVGNESSEPCGVAIDPEQLAYVIFTSGSTGRPKGVGITQANVARLLSATRAQFAFDEHDVWTLFHSYAFDFSVWEIFGALVQGARLVVVPYWSARDTRAFHALLRDQQVTVLNQTPSAFVPLMQHDLECRRAGAASLDRLRVVVFGGEKLEPSLLGGWIEAGGAHAPAMVNMYGITETTVHVTYRRLARDEMGAGARSVIGEALADLTLHVLDEDMNPVPRGATGELYVGGAGLARGYLGRPGLSAERFVPDPWSPNGARLYRSGDLARREADGEIVYIGRNDAQVKIRGFRIELGEIDAALAALPSVREARVLAHEGRTLVAYVVPRANQGCDVAQLEASLAGVLPAHMVPGAYVLLDALPLTHNGKLDRAALPAPQSPGAGEPGEHIEPVTPSELALAQIWRDVLGLERVGAHDDFFRVGGDSILSLQVVARAQEVGLDITPRQLFEHPNIAALAAVADTQRDRPRARASVERHDTMPLTPIQSWFFELHPRGESHWNQAVLLRSDAVLDTRALQSAWQRLQKRHDALRLRFVRDGATAAEAANTLDTSPNGTGGWQQRVLPFDGGTQIDSVDLRTLPDAAARLDARCEEAQRSLDIERGPLCRLLHIAMDDGERVLIVVHHLAVDGVSWRILLRELERDYSAALAHPHDTKDETGAPTPWSAWVAVQRAHAASAEVVADASAWRAALAAADAWLPLSKDAGSAATFGASRTREARFDADLTRRLSSHATRAYRLRVDELLLTAFAQTLSGWRERPGALIDVESHGRTHPVGELDLSGTLGWFTTRYPLWIDTPDDAAEALLRVKDQVRDVRFDGIQWMWLTHTDAARPLADLPRAQVSFNYLGRFDTSLEQNGQFRFADEAGGTPLAAGSPLPYAIDVNGLIANEGLSLTWRYSPATIDDATIARLVDDFETRVRRLVDHCEAAQAVPTRQDFELARLTRAQFDEVAAQLPGDVADLYPATPLQQGILYHSLIDESQQSYTNQLHLTLNGRLDVAALDSAWQRAVARHDILRTQFFWQHDGAPLQVVRRAVSLPFERVSLNAQDSDTYALRLAQWRDADLRKGFRFDAAPLMRVALFERPDGAHDLVWTHHHLLMDGWSSAQLLSEVAQTYRALTAGEAETATAPAPRFHDYIRWLQAQPDGESWWREQLARRDEPAQLQAGVGRPAVPGTGIAQRRVVLDDALCAVLSQAGRTLGVTLNTIVQGAWALLLTRYGNRQQAAFGVTVSGRPATLRGSQQMLGLFIHSLPLYVDARPDARVAGWLRGIQEQNVALRQHEHTPLAQIQQWAGQGGESLFDSLLVFENYPIDEGARDQRGALEIVANESVDPTHYPLTLSILPREGVEIEWSWNAALFDASTIERLSSHYVSLLRQICEAGERRLCELSMDEGAGASSVAQRVAYPYASTVSRFEARARSCSAELALICEDERVSYAQLDGWADRLGVSLMQAGIAHEDRVGVCLERSAGLAAALLGIWKAGAAQVPLDPAYPEGRLREMIEDAGVRCVIVDAASAARLAPVLEGCAQVRIVDEGAGPGEGAEPDDRAGLEEGALSALRERTASIHPEQLAYVIYTSGSTGRPKGVAVSQRSLALHLDDFIGTYGISAQDTLLQSSTINFDVALHELLPALLMGGRVCMRGASAWDLQALSGALAAHRVTFSRIPTALWQQWLGEAPSRESLPALRQITVGGEGLPGDALARWFRGGLASVRLDNLYGPTETSVAALYRRTQPEDIHHVSAPIGVAYPGRSVCVLDADGNEVPVGGLGELCIGGDSLARGYLGRAGLTAERFVPSPYGHGERLYRSGDLCRLRADGCIEYLGRLDQQVKLRGYRIELGEIEVQLRGCAGVDQAVVALRGEGERRRLVAYWVGEAQAGELQAALQARLPGYMVPGGWMKLAQLPVMANGKLDRGALPAPREDQEVQSVAPRSEREARLRDIWAAVLGREAQQLGVTQNFFEAGGDSIVSLQLIAKARQMGLKLTPKQVFDHPTIEAQARVAVVLAESGEGEGEGSRAGQAEVHDAVPLTPIQQWFFERFAQAPSHWNQAVLLRVRGSLDEALLERALQALVAQHDALRLRFVRDAGTGGWTQRVVPVAVASDAADAMPPTGLVERISVGDAEGWEQALYEACTQVQRQLDLGNGPLLKAACLDVGRHGQRVLLAIHHLAVDGVSWRILLEQLQQAYEQAERGEAIGMGARSTPFSVWSVRQQEYGMRAERLAELGWWQQRLTGVMPWPPLRTAAQDAVQSGAERTHATQMGVTQTGETQTGATQTDTTQTDTTQSGVTQTHATQTHTLRLDAPTTSALLYNSARNTGLTPEVLLLAALTQTLSQRSGQSRVLIELEGHGREDVLDDIDLTRTVGWFTTRYPVVFEAATDTTHTLHTVRTSLAAVPQRGLHWGLLEARGAIDPTVHEALAGLPRARVGFNYLGQFDASLPDSSRFAFADEAGGESVQADLQDAQIKVLQLDALVAGGELQISWRYRTPHLTQEEIEACAAGFRHNLHAMIESLGVSVQRSTPAEPHLFSSRYAVDDDDESGIWVQRFNAESAVNVTRSVRAEGQLPAGLLALNSLRAPERLFCIHPGYGLVAEYSYLAEALNGVATVYAIQSPMFSDSAWSVESFEALARDYVERIRTVQPQGPYRLLGWSFGGRVAVAMAACLEAQGETVDLVGLGDTASHFSLPPSAERDADPREVESESADLPAFSRALRLAMRVDAYHVELLRAHALPRIVAPITLWRAAQSEVGAERRLDWAHHTAGQYRETLVSASHSTILRQALLHDELRAWFTARR